MLRDYWAEIMLGGGGTREECKRYIETLPVPEMVQFALPLLMKPQSGEVVQAVLESMKGGSSAGADGMPAELYQQFPSVFVPRMSAAMECFSGGRGVFLSYELTI